jgi:hydrogenase maturation factor
LTWATSCSSPRFNLITFAADSIGWYAVVNANDIATTGATPHWFMATVPLPESRADVAMAETILARSTPLRDRRIWRAGTPKSLTGWIAPLSSALCWAATRDDHAIRRAVLAMRLLTKGIAVEGTAIMAREQNSGLEDEFLENCRNFLTRPGISIVRDAAIATDAGRVHAMHDPTEGGLATGLHELAQASSVGLMIEASAVPVYAETQVLCRALGLDPWGVIASGALLLAVEAADAENICRALETQVIRAAHIGRVTDAANTVLLRDALAYVIAPTLSATRSRGCLSDRFMCR